MTPTRCQWAGDKPLYIDYHDNEWGVPVCDDRLLFEKLSLEGAQAGLSWYTILKKRPHYRRLFLDFDIEKVASFDPITIDEILTDAGIIRNRAKVQSVVHNAQIVLSIMDKYGSFSDFMWDFVGGTTIQNQWQHSEQVPATSPESDRMSKALKKMGFKYVGSITCYALMQSVGMINDHTTDCFRHAKCAELAK